MTFKLTEAHVRAFLDPCASGDWTAFEAAIDPDVRWWIAADAEDLSRGTGVFNLATWREKIINPVFARLVAGELRVELKTLDIVGDKAFAQCEGRATQKNGAPYNDNYCWIMRFDSETGKVVELREYLNTALVQEVLAGPTEV